MNVFYLKHYFYTNDIGIINIKYKQDFTEGID